MIFLVEIEATAIGEIEVEADSEEEALSLATEQGLEKNEVDELRDPIAKRAREIS